MEAKQLWLLLVMEQLFWDWVILVRSSYASYGRKINIIKFGNIDAVPICLDTKIQKKLFKLSSNCLLLGLILEDINAPRCVEIEEL